MVVTIIMEINLLIFQTGPFSIDTGILSTFNQQLWLLCQIKLNGTKQGIVLFKRCFRKIQICLSCSSQFMCSSFLVQSQRTCVICITFLFYQGPQSLVIFIWELKFLAEPRIAVFTLQQVHLITEHVCFGAKG